MPQRRVQDIIVERPGSKIPLRILSEKNRARESSSVVLARSGGRVVPPRRPDTRYRDGEDKPRRFSHLALWGSSIVALFVLIFAVSTFFEKATLQISPKQKITSFDSIIVARKGSGQTAKNILSFEVMELEERATRKVAATSLLQVDRRAFGEIIIYND